MPWNSFFAAVLRVAPVTGCSETPLPFREMPQSWTCFEETPHLLTASFGWPAGDFVLDCCLQFLSLMLFD